MSILLIAFALLIIFGFPLAYRLLPGMQKIDNGESFLSKNLTDALKGIASFMIVFAHIFQFADYSSTIIGGGYNS